MLSTQLKPRFDVVVYLVGDGFVFIGVPVKGLLVHAFRFAPNRFLEVIRCSDLFSNFACFTNKSINAHFRLTAVGQVVAFAAQKPRASPGKDHYSPITAWAA